jgi:hypothetical protein
MAIVMADSQTVYVDDSGTEPNQKIAAAAFCVATVDQWQQLLKEWNKIANREGFELKNFHMTEFAACRPTHICPQCQHEHTSAREHPWQRWSDQKRESVLRRMAKAVARHIEFGVGHAYTKADYDEHVRNSPVRHISNAPIGDEYLTFAVQRCGGSLAEWRALSSRRDRLKFVFDSSSKKEKKEIANVFFAAANDRERIVNGVEQWFNPEEGVSYESRKVTHQLLSADMLAWTIATIRARDMFISGQLATGGRFAEVLWLARVFVDTGNIKIGYLMKETLLQWEREQLNATAREQGIPEAQSDNAETDLDPAQ